jgi:hypothetical protein
MGWEYILIFIISLVVCYAMTPKVAQPTPTSLDDMNLPTAEPGRCIGVVFGTRLLKSPNVVWYGDLRYDPVNADSGK